DLRDKTDEHPVRGVERQVVRESEVWKSRNPVANADRGPVKRGVGFARSVWYRFVSMNSNAEVRIHKDGSVEVLSGVQDIGSGIRTVMAQILAEQFGIPPSQIAVKVGDTNYTPGPESGGSVTTLSLTPAVRDAAWQASQKFLADIAPGLGVSAADLVIVDGEVRSRSGKFEPVSFKRAAAKMTSSQISVQAKRVPDYDPKKYLTYGGVDVAEVEVDTELGRIHVRRVLSVHDCGRPMNPVQTISQINGGVIQGISFTLLENRLLDPVYGIMVNPDLEQYKIVGAREIPEIDVRLVEAYLGQSSTDASGIAEAAGVISIGAAIGNAVQRDEDTNSPNAHDSRSGARGAQSARAGKGDGMNRFSMADCTTVDAALSQLKDGAVVKAGGVDLLDRMKDGIEQPARLVNIRNVSDLRGIRETDQGLTIGPLTTLAEISDHPVIRTQYQILADACGHAATPHIRNMATVGGNLLQRVQCWYYRSSDFQCIRHGKDICFAFDGLNQYHAIMEYSTCPSVAPSSAAVALL